MTINSDSWRSTASVGRGRKSSADNPRFPKFKILLHAARREAVNFWKSVFRIDNFPVKLGRLYFCGKCRDFGMRHLFRVIISFRGRKTWESHPPTPEAPRALSTEIFFIPKWNISFGRTFGGTWPFRSPPLFLFAFFRIYVFKWKIGISAVLDSPQERNVCSFFKVDCATEISNRALKFSRHISLLVQD